MTGRADESRAGAAALAELREVALAREPDRYFAATLAPATVRYDLIVLAAFAAEIARIPAMVREPLAGEIRLQWWRDALAPGGSEAAAGHPVATAMRATIDRFGLPPDIVDSVIDVEGHALHGERPADEAALRARMAAGEGALFRLAARICAGGAAGAHDDGGEVAAAAGLAYGLSRALASFPADAAAWFAIPRSLVADDAGAPGSPEDALGDDRVVAGVRVLSALARDAQAEAAARLRRYPRRERLVFLPLAMVKPNLAALEGTLIQRETRSFEPSPVRRLIRLGWAYASGRL